MDSTLSALARKSLIALAILVCLGGNLCLAVKKDNPADHVAMGDDQLGRCNPAGAIVEYDLALRLKPSLKRVVGKWLAVSHFMLAEKLANQKNYNLALAELDKALELRPKEAYWHLAKALLQARTGKSDSARSECGLASQLAKKDPGLKETCRDPGQKFTYYFAADTFGPPAGSFADLESVKLNATSPPVAMHVPFYRRQWPGSMVAVIATIGTDGKVSDMQIVKPMGLGLDRKALRILEKSRFEPAMRKGSPVETRALITILFGATCRK